MTDLRVALLSSCTIDLFQKPLAGALESRDFRASMWIGGFGQARQDILNPSSELYGHEPAVVVLYMDAGDLFRELLENPFAYSSDARKELALRCVHEVAALAEVLTERLPHATVLLNTVVVDPLNSLVGLEYNSEYGFQDAADTFNTGLGAIVTRLPGAVIVDVASLAARIGFENWRDSRLWYLARSRWSRKAMNALAEHYAAVIASKLGRIRKCVVLDLDNTLWGGVVGEDGIEGLRLGEDGIGRAFVEFQMELLNLNRRGVLLAICSKNNLEDAIGVIRRHPAMRLREEHFAAMRINWEDKSANLRAIAEELNIGLDSFVFLDDNPVEREWVRQSVPEIMVPEWPADPADYKTALLEISSRYLCTLSLTHEDRTRGELYKAQGERQKFEASASSVEDFYRTLQMRARIGLADAFSIPRIAQLTQKTNQFNLTTRRYAEAEISAFSRDANSSVWWLELSDRFGPNGIIGVLVLKRQSPDVWFVDSFLLSCRVMGRTAEIAFLAVVARELGARKLIGEFRPTAKNHPVRDLYARLGFNSVPQVNGGEFWELDLSNVPLEPPPWFEIEVARSGVAA
jgi:FkbH-like protein